MSLLPSTGFYLLAFVAGALPTAEAAFSTPPLSIQLSASKPRSLAGEAIVLELRQTVRSALQMETVELNRSRTEIKITPLGSQAGERVLSGKDYLRLHGQHPLSEIGRSFRAEAGAQWTSRLNLCDYSLPLEAGKYRIALSYRYGDSEEAILHPDPVEVEVVPARLLTARFRWFGGSNSRQELGAVWTTRDGALERWFYQVSSRNDPAALLTSTEFLTGSTNPAVVPRLAFLNDLAASQFERFVIWQEGPRVHWQIIRSAAGAAPPGSADLGLNPNWQLAEPPLQKRTGDLVIAAVGSDFSNRTCVVLLTIDNNQKWQSRRLRVKAADILAAALWDGTAQSKPDSLYFVAKQADSATALTRLDLGSGKEETLFELPGRLLALSADQWLGRGSLWAVVQSGSSLQTLRWALPVTKGNPQSRTESTWLDSWLEVVDSAPLAEAQQLALLIRAKSGWVATVGQQSFPLPSPADSDAAPHIIAAPGPHGLFLLRHLPNKGFISARIGGE